MPDLPPRLDGYGALGTFAGDGKNAGRRRKLLRSLGATIDAPEPKCRATISFHHHLRNGDGVLNAVQDAAARRC